MLKRQLRTTEPQTNFSGSYINKSKTHYRSASRTSSNYLIIYDQFNIKQQFTSRGMILH